MNPETPLAIATAPKRNSLHWKLDTVTWGDVCDWVASPAAKKEAGNYLLGTLRPTTVVHDPSKPKEKCTNTHRRKDAVVSRSALSLDIDKAELDFADKVELLFPHAALIHTTFQSTPDAPRYRLLIPLDREVLPDEYIALATSVIQDLGKDQFDPGSTQPERYMFKPSAERPEWFFSLVIDGDPMPVDEVLAEFVEDLSELPIPNPSRNKRNPFEIDGVIGAFNTAYEDWDLLIETYELPYEKIDDNRYHLAGSRSEAGMGPVAGVRGFVYSHHANDPAYGKTCSAFDLVRLHKFGELDETANDQTPVNKLPSNSAMLEIASGDHRVVAALVGIDFGEDMDEEAIKNDWRIRLRLTPKTGSFVDCIQNWDLVVANDPVFNTLVYNELTLSPEADRDLPWRKVTRDTRIFTNTDRWEMVYYIERQYNFRASRALMDSFIDTKSWQRIVNPVRDYLESLVWDRTPRVETCLPGVRVTDFTRQVARKSLVAAAARMLDPGCKWDHTLVLQGDEGLGKSWWINKMARGYSSSLGDISNKDTLLAMQRTWIMVADEGHSLRKGDADALKEFLTRTEDMFRMPFDRETLVHKRHSVIWSSINDETFLRRQQGNRRFLVVQVEDKVDFDDITDEYVDQVWAEAVYLYKAGERLYLDEEESLAAAIQRERFVEEDALGGIISEYLDQLVPDNWWELSVEARMSWMNDRDHVFGAEGTMEIDRTCSTQIWVEALGRRIGDHRRADLLDITTALKRIPGWKAIPGRGRIPGYGPQMIFVRDDLL